MPGVIYIQTVPPFFTVKRLREIMARFDGLGRVYLQSEKRGVHRKKRYTEGWVEFKSKKVAKEVTRLLNGRVVGGRRRSAAYDSVWTMKYLHGFKWEHLMEQLSYEQRIEQQRLRTEIVVEKRKAEYFAQQVEKGERLKQLEEKILKKCGLWEQFQRQHKQQKAVGGDERNKKLDENESLLLQIFGGDAEDDLQRKEKESGLVEETEERDVEDDLHFGKSSGRGNGKTRGRRGKNKGRSE
uniref:Activator of basal transcription 1 n=1 Tax=Globodera pallida TaxID=36090 RepID=A0A183C911_GLOPA